MGGQGAIDFGGEAIGQPCLTDLHARLERVGTRLEM
jgi:hypothetical protein